MSEIEYVQVAEVSELPSGERLFVELDGDPVVIFNIGGDYFAIGDVCTHDDGPLGEGELDNHHVICPRHGARFDVRDGKALTLPAVAPTTSYPVRVRDGWIEIGI